MARGDIDQAQHWLGALAHTLRCNSSFRDARSADNGFHLNYQFFSEGLISHADGDSAA
jgi:hypothetical protein